MNLIEAKKSGKKVIPKDGIWDNGRNVNDGEWLQFRGEYLNNARGLISYMIPIWLDKEWVEYSEYKEYTPPELAQMMYDGKRLGSKDGSIIYYDKEYSSPFRYMACKHSEVTSEMRFSWTNRKWKVLDE